MTNPTAPVLFGRRMKRTDRHASGETYDLVSGRVLFQIIVSRIDGVWFDALLYVDGRSIECCPSRSLDVALRNLIRVRNRLVKSLTPEGG